MKTIGVMQIVDTLIAGGMERVAVNLANVLPRDRYRSYLCTTRSDGPLDDAVRDDVGRLRLGRRRTFEVKALYRLVEFIGRKKIAILHAHDAALLLANIASRFPPFPAVIWHDHCGPNMVDERPVRTYRFLARRAAGVLATSRELQGWSRDRLRVSAGRVWYVPNFVSMPGAVGAAPEVPGTDGARIVCVGNLRPAKDHLTLLRAMAIVIEKCPRAHLLLVGGTLDKDYESLLYKEMAEDGLAGNVSLLGQRLDVPEVLRQCDVAVLSSVAETCPLAILEYAMARLPVVSTDVGQCGEVLDGGEAGIVVPSRDPEALAGAMVRLLGSAELRTTFGKRLHEHVESRFSEKAVMGQICRVYESILKGSVESSAKGVGQQR